jgi:[CysO sulfur-carrier protein]-S-L-cysteine hydrolase
MSSQMTVSRLGRPRDCICSVFERRSPAEGETRLIISDSVANDIVRHMWQCLPCEGVGLLATSAMGPNTAARRFYPGRNLDASPTRYTMDPGDVLAALRDMERRRMRLLATVHSHPVTPPVPSASDLSEAAVPGALSLIVGLTPVIVLRAWQFVLNDAGIAVGGKEVQIVRSCDGSSNAAGLQFANC